MTAKHPEIPDPISAQEGDPYYSPWAHSIEVKLDGHVLKNCVAVSAKEGWVKVTVRDANGRLVERGGDMVTEIKHGVVELSWIERA